MNIYKEIEPKPSLELYYITEYMTNKLHHRIVKSII